MKPGPVFAMVAFVALGMWLVLQPTLSSPKPTDPSSTRFELRIGATRHIVEQRPSGDGFEYHFIGGSQGWLTESEFAEAKTREYGAWVRRPVFERTLLGFFNISSWLNFGWVMVGLVGQGAFFGRMFIQWVISEKSRKSQVPELFWWFSFIGGVCLFTYFVWRRDVVGVLGQSTGVVIYARNLRLIHKERRRAARHAQSEVRSGG